MPSQPSADIAIIGLGVMGCNLALNFADHGYNVVAYDAFPQVAEKASQELGERVTVCSSLGLLVAALKKPAQILMMVKAGQVVDDALASLTPLLSAGDIVIDGGNSFYRDTERRQAEMEARGLAFIGLGVSGGETGARFGPALMGGGAPEALSRVEKAFSAIAAKAKDGTGCYVAHGSGGAGHFVKTVHNGIEYALMQLLAEAYLMLKGPAGLSHQAIADRWRQWNQGPSASYLLEISADIAATIDPDSGNPLVEMIRDVAGHKGTGRWTTEAGLDYGVAVPTIAAAFMARAISGLPRLDLTKQTIESGSTDHALADALELAFPAAMFAAYLQGLELIEVASNENYWDIDLAKVAKGWRSGCIIRSVMLDPIADSVGQGSVLESAYGRDLLQLAEQPLRAVVQQAAASGTPVPAFYSVLGWLDGRRSSCLGANFIQGQRDYFGAHTFERIDRSGHFHFNWQSN
ncbi:NADP-dependent phosphogluconate dehydrogenase [Cohaesibacter celericrescens]|uniref:6-phosphogluconate dehydrogenase, decarboxylating n=1 Tax=Cohaesibacter celericrescens TaxID=2067669 RepID=A0A2N5XLQ0_9HYPH|nr:NADP-dependent phosphogluconate dehydrogenase [Cohaesibacter celericrescens]PLW75424.1 phosphogluconate dehydrogenase (NADP(+)-dependent, decarboxylating) [Cohaesibacter celericrescens]